MQYGVNGFDVYCDFERTLETCLGDLMTSPCMNPDAFVKMYGVNEVEAIDYATTYPVEAYTCQNIDREFHLFSLIKCFSYKTIQGLIDCSVEMSKEFQDTTLLFSPVDHYVSCIENYYV
ncbi:hypothetical protein PENTCL1PPCAC_4880, partial [Pristionchus entomophagus]